MLNRLVRNGFWTLLNSRNAAGFRLALRNPRRTQERILQRYLRANATSAYGREYRYDRISTVEAFQDAVPIVSYEDLEPWIDRALRGEPEVLTTEPIRFFERTSGSSGSCKYIPYTQSLLGEFRRGVAAWMFDLFARRPALLGGAQYWSISPAGRPPETTSGGIPVGISDDTEYLGRLARAALSGVMAVPPEVGGISDMSTWREASIRHLIRCRDLRFLSVWNPSFLTLLIDHFPEGLQPADCWPELRLISCWTDGTASRFLPSLRSRFPGVEIQGKGLLATEGILSIPLLGRPASVPAITSHFLEFVDEQSRVRLVDELETGRRYRVLITTAGGFARYDLGDQVEAIAPMAIRFVGRAGTVTDLCGEKLSDAFVGVVLLETVREGCFSMLAPAWGDPPRYLLFVESGQADRVAHSVEQGLRQSVHYDYCRRLGQLDPLEGVAIQDGARRYLEACVAMGQRVGDVKPTALRTEFGWQERMVGDDAAV